MKNFVLALMCLVCAFGGYWPVQAQEQSCKLELRAGDSPELEFYRLLGCLEGQLVVARSKQLATVPVLEAQLAQLKKLETVTAGSLSLIMTTTTTRTTQQSSSTSQPSSSHSYVTVTTVKRDTTTPVVRPQETSGAPMAQPSAMPLVSADTRQVFEKFAQRQRQILSGTVRTSQGGLFYTAEPNWQGGEKEFRQVLAASQNSLDLQSRFGHFVMDYTHTQSMSKYVQEYKNSMPHLDYLRNATGYHFVYDNGVLQRVTANLYGGQLTLRRAKVLDDRLWTPGTIQYQLVWRNPAAYLPENIQVSREEDERPLRDRYTYAAALEMSVAEEMTLYSVVSSTTSSRLLKAYLGQNTHDVQVSAAATLHEPYNYTTYYVTLIPKGK